MREESNTYNVRYMTKRAVLCCERRPYTPPSGVTPPRSFMTLLRTGNLAAHPVDRLMLLDPSPDMVHGSALRETRSSTQDHELNIRKNSTLRRGIHPCCSGLQVQGAAISPAGMAYFHSRKTATVILYHRMADFARGFAKIQENFTFGRFGGIGRGGRGLLPTHRAAGEVFFFSQGGSTSLLASSRWEREWFLRGISVTVGHAGGEALPYGETVWLSPTVGCPITPVGATIGGWWFCGANRRPSVISPAVRAWPRGSFCRSRCRRGSPRSPRTRWSSSRRSRRA